jgi:hypothetical protein
MICICREFAMFHKKGCCCIESWMEFVLVISDIVDSSRTETIGKTIDMNGNSCFGIRTEDCCLSGLDNFMFDRFTMRIDLEGTGEALTIADSWLMSLYIEFHSFRVDQILSNYGIASKIVNKREFMSGSTLPTLCPGRKNVIRL